MEKFEAAVILTDGFEDIEAVVLLDILRRGGIRAAAVSITGGTAVKSSHDMIVMADVLFENADFSGCRVICLPGGSGYSKYIIHSGLCTLAAKFAGAGRYIAAICAAPTFLGALGLLEGKKAVCYPGMEDGLKGALHTDEPVVTDGCIITSRSPGTGIAFALAVLELLKGTGTANEVSESLFL